MNNPDTETRARRIIERLKMFNRKERDHLMKFALCENQEAPRISTALWKKISNGGKRPNPDAMFVGMDYHLNWLYAALATAEDDDLTSMDDPSNKWKCVLPPQTSKKDSNPIQDNQEDVDLLIAWFDQRWAMPLRLILVEAKLDSGWGSKQFKSKKERLTLIREDTESRGLKFIDWRFLLMSPGSAPMVKKFKTGSLDGRYSWLRAPKEEVKESQSPVRHVKLPLANDLWRVKRVSKSSKNWTVIPSKPATKKKAGSKG